jgi:diguanylate cyclase (GGDEF)-like protein
MTTIYVLADEHLADVSDLESQLLPVVGDRYAIERVPGQEALYEALREAHQAVVFFSAPATQLAAFVLRCRETLPATAFVALTDEREWQQIPVLETDCHFIRRPLDGFAVLSQLAAAVRQAELLSSVADGAHLDEVTNLFNRRYFIQRLGEEISLSRRHLSPLCCVVLGINCYQLYLDSYGYDFINALLRFIADKTNGLVRHEDMVARIGDDEIGILLPRSTEKGAKVFTNRLILSLNSAVFKYGAYEEEISVCAGVAGYPLPDGAPADADTVIRYGRHALHQARCTEEDDIHVQLFSEIRPVL